MIRDILNELYGDVADALLGYTKVDECVPYVPYNCKEVVDIITNNLIFGKNIAIHADIDMDGFGCAYILNKFIKAIRNDKQLVIFTNKEKYHGITKEFIEYINDSDFDLLIVVDSSSNEVELIRQLKCDAVVIDHHEVSERAKNIGLKGDTLGGKYAVATNMLGSEEDSKLSGCGVVYYILRELCSGKIKINMDDLNLRLEQWVGLTLISDVIQLANKRCQYFINKLYEDDCIEQGISTMMGSLNVSRVDKNLIAYKIVPLINSAIRCGNSLQALNVVLKESSSISELEQFKEYQRKLVRYALTYGSIKVSDNLVSMNINDIEMPLEIRKNYCGVIAAQLCSIYGKTAYVYVDNGGVYKGSVRGVNSDEDYRLACEKIGLDARGHKSAFGLDINKNNFSKLESLMCKFKKGTERFISVGQVRGGILHIDNLQELRKGGDMMLLASANSRLSSNETVSLHAKLDNLEYSTRGKCKVYKLDDIELISFDELRSTDVNIYAEFSNFGISLYVSNDNK